MQRLKRILQVTSHLLAIVGFLFMQSGWADDLDERIQLASLSPNDVISNAKTCFRTVKKNGTVWLQTQNAMERLIALEKEGSPTQTTQLAQSIAEDCRLIRNQHALEQARYLLSTLESMGFEDQELDAIRVQLKAADGEASLALAKNLTRELP